MRLKGGSHTAGQERFRSITQTYYRGCQAALIVFDLTDTTSFLRVCDSELTVANTQTSYWLNEMEKEADKPIIVIVGNKCDLTDARTVNEEEIRSSYGNNKYFECSAQSGKNIEQVFYEIAKEYLQTTRTRQVGGSDAHTDREEPLPDDVPIVIKEKKKSCC